MTEHGARTLPVKIHAIATGMSFTKEQHSLDHFSVVEIVWIVGDEWVAPSGCFHSPYYPGRRPVDWLSPAPWTGFRMEMRAL